MRYFLLIFAIFLTACSTKITTQTPISQGFEKTNILENKYAKLDFEQNASILPTLNESVKFDANAYKKAFFKPWNVKKDYFTKVSKNKSLFWAFDLYLNPKNSYYFYNKKEIPKEWFKEVIANANSENLGIVSKKALVVQNTILKNLPTQKAVLKNPFLEGEGLPFDYTNDSVLNVGQAVLVSHFSKDRQFAFVMSDSGFGFVLSKDLEFLNNEKIKTYQKLDFITPLKEKLVIFDSSGEFFFQTRIGAIYPYYKDDNEYFYGKIGSKKYKISKQEASKFPLKFSDKFAKNQIAELLNLPYGWGGYDFERDCSLLTREFFSAFGLFMPRNSKAQNEYFTHFDISFLSTAQKQDFIKKFAKPYTTLFYLKGHIMVFVGLVNDEVAAFHSAWGLAKSQNERVLIAGSAITSLNVGKELVGSEKLLISRLKELSFVSLNDNEKEQISSYLESLKGKE